MSRGQASAPPVAADFTLSSSLNESDAVCVRVMPAVAAPFGSLSAITNSMRASAASALKGCGIEAMSPLVLRKSRFSTAIWLAICASEMFCAGSLKTTCTTTGMTVTPVRALTPPIARKLK